MRPLVTISLMQQCLLQVRIVMGNTAVSMSSMVKPENALPGRSNVMVVADKHAVSRNPTRPPFPQHMQLAMFGMGCFWGAEKTFWKLAGVFSTQVGYTGGYTKNPLYDEVCSGATGHNEVVRVVFDPDAVTYARLLAVFWQSHNPTQAMRQGNDVGTQYRSAVYYHSDEQRRLAAASLTQYEAALAESGLAGIATEVTPATEFFYAEDYHQQYLHKNPGGYCGLGGTGVECTFAAEESVPRSDL